MKKLMLSLAALAVISMLAVPAFAATQWNFGASLRYATFWTEVDYGKAKGPDLDKGYRAVDHDGLLTWGTQGNTRIKMFMKSDSLEGFIELGYNFDSNSVTTREIWGKYRFADAAFIQIGQIHQLFNTPGLSNQVWGDDIGMHSIGVSFNPPTPKIVLGYGGFSFALAQPFKGTGWALLPTAVPPAGATTAFKNADIDAWLPQIQASYQYKADTWRVKLAGAYQYIELNKLTWGTVTGPAPGTYTGFANKDKSINSWLLYVDGDIFFGPLYLKGSASVGQNWTDAQWNTSRGGLGNDFTNQRTLGAKGAAVKGDKIKNTNSAMGAIIAGYRLTEALTFEAGIGYRYDDNDAWRTDSNMWNVYLQAVYMVAPGFSITPEIGYIDLGKTAGSAAGKGVDAGYTWYAGAKWQMDF